MTQWEIIVVAQNAAHANAYVRPAHLDLNRIALFRIGLIRQWGQNDVDICVTVLEGSL